MGTDGDKFDNSQNNNKSETVYARLVLTDGTIVKVETDAKKSEIANLRNQLVAYSVDKNDVYTLNVKGEAKADVADAVSDVKIENGKAGFKAYNAGNSYSANSNTVFVVVDSDDKYDDYDVTVYTGIKNVPDIDAIANKTVSAVALDNKGAVAKVVYIEDGDVSGTEQVIYAIANTNAKIQKDKENGEYYEITAVVNGEIKTLNVKAGSNSAVDALVKNVDTNNAAKISGTKYVVALKSITENADGFITSAKVYAKLDADNDGVLDTSNKLYVTGTMKAENGTVGLANKYYAYSDDVIVARWDLDDQDVELSRINSVKNDSNDVAVAIMDGNTVIGLFIIEVKGGEGENNTPVVDTEVNVDGRYEAIYKDAGITTTVKGDKITFNVNRKALKEFINNPANKTDVAEMIGGEHGRENNLWVGASFKAPEGAKTAVFAGDVTGTDNVENGYVYLWSAVADGSADAGWTVKTQDASRTFTITWKNTQGEQISKDSFTVAVDIQ